MINEIYYHPPSGNAREEFIELHNPGPTAVPMAGWQFTRGVRYTFPAANLPAGGFLVVAADPTVFRGLYPDVAAVVGGWEGSLSRGGERLELQDAAGATVDEVTYADEGDWAIRWRTADWLSIPTWEWYAMHDSAGRSLELVDAGRDNDCGQNWGASPVAGGSPGERNGLARLERAPFITGVTHMPAVPRSSDAVTVSARVQSRGDEAVTATLWHRTDGEPAFTKADMLDAGQHGDLAAGDGLHAAVIPPRPQGTVVEFYVQAVAAGGAARRWPALPYPADAQPANLLYQVDDAPSAGSLPFYRLIMTEADRVAYTNRVATEPTLFSNASVNATFVSWVDGRHEVRYLTDVRNRGAGTRRANFMSFRVNFPGDAPWHGVERINLNAFVQTMQILGSALSQLAGLAMPESRAVHVRLNNWNPATPGWPRFGFYAHNEVLDADYTDRHQLGPANVYRGMRDYSGVEPDFTYRGESPPAYARDYYKETNQTENDWTDLIALTRTLDPAQTPDDRYVAEVRKWVAVTNWVRYFAVNSLLLNRETSLVNGVGDDYAMYRDVATGQFHLVPWDLDTILNEGDTHGAVATDLFEATRLVTINRFLKHPQFAPLYYRELLRLCDTVFALDRFEALLRQTLEGLVDDALLARVADFMPARRAYVLGQIPLELTIEHGLPLANGYPRTRTNSVVLEGRAHAADTRSVRVNGAPAIWSAWEARWRAAAVPLYPGLNRILIQAMDEGGQELGRRFLDVWHDRGVNLPVRGSIEADTTWEPLDGVREVTNDLVVSSDATLTVRPGTSVYFGPAARLVVRGRLVVQGGAAGRVRFTRAPGTQTQWGGIVFADTPADNLLAGLDLEYGDGRGALIAVRGSRLRLQDVTCEVSGGTALQFERASLRVERCWFAGSGAGDVISGTGILDGGELRLSGNTWMGLDGAGCAFRFAGAQRPGPIPVLHDNLFAGVRGNALRLAGADAHLEGNRFRVTGAEGETGIVIAGGASRAPALLLARNQFCGLRQAVLAQDGTFLTLHNNTFADLSDGAIRFGAQAGGSGATAGLEGVNNLFHRVGKVVAGTEQLPVPPQLSWRWSLFSATTPSAGEGNREGDPRLAWVGERLAPQPGSAALGQGWAGWDIGAHVSAGVTVSGDLASPTPSHRARLRVWGPGIEAYVARVDGNTFGAVRPVAEAIEVEGLDEGAHVVEVRAIAGAETWLETGHAGQISWEVADEAPAILLSELQAHRPSGSKASGPTAGWIELVNRGDRVLALDGLGLTDDKDTPYRYRFAGGQTLAPGAFRVVTADELGFSLDPRGEAIRLTAVGERMLDRIEYGPQVDGWSVARDRTGNWQLAWPTPGAANQPCPTGNPALLCLNEWLTRGRTAAEAEFVELYNRDLLPVALRGLFLSDYPGTAPLRQALPPLGFVAGQGWLVLRAGEDPERGGLAFNLTADQGVIGLQGTDGEPIDVVWYPPQPTGVSTGRNPDGADHITTFEIPRPGAANVIVSNLPAAEVRLNELLADNRSVFLEDGYLGDWIELRNLSPRPANLEGMTLEDSSATRRYAFPTGTWMPAESLRVWRCDPDSPASAANTGFGLSRAGDELRLFHAGNGGLADSIRFGFQAPDVTLARSPTNVAVWGAGRPTPALPNLPHADPGTHGLRINEWMARPATGDDWFELYNPADAPVNVGGLFLTDDPAAPTRHRIADYSFIGGDWFRYQKLVADENTAAGADHVGFRMSASGESILLLDAEGRLIDQVRFGNQAEGVSEGRLPDGDATWQRFPAGASPGAANCLDSDFDGLPDDWEQTYGFNPGASDDPASDTDRDRAGDFDEFLAGTDPRDPEDSPTLGFVLDPDHGWKLRFVTRPGRTYLIESAAQISPAAWSRVMEFPARGRQEAVDFVDRGSSGSTARFYRLRIK